MRVFISHINEEAPLALALKDWIETSFAGQCTVFVSSDKDDIPVGTKWFEEIEQALDDAAVLIVLCSPQSLSRPWINFETGCGWMKKRPIIPVCHSGQKKAALPPPISRFQAIELEDERFITDFLSGLAKHLKFGKVPRIDESAMKSDLKKSLGQTGGAAAPPTHLPGNGDLPAGEVSVLQHLIDEADEMTAEDLANALSIKEQKAQYFLDQLKEKELVSRTLFMGRPAIWYLTKGGRKYLVDRNLL